MVEVSYRLRGANGDIIIFDNENYVLNPGMIGFGIPPTNVRIEESAGAGGVFRHSKRGIRDVDLPITILGNSQSDVETKLRRLARLTQDGRGPFVLRALYTDGSALDLSLHYTGGAESQWGPETGGDTYCRWTISAQAPQPYWQSSQLRTVTLQGGTAGRGLLPELTKLKVASSGSLGDVEIVSDADVPVFPIYTIEGPVTGFAVSNGLDSFSISDPILFGETIIIDTEAGTVVDSTGANRYSLLDAAPKLFPFQPGTTDLEINGTDIDANTNVVISYALRFEVVH